MVKAITDAVEQGNKRWISARDFWATWCGPVACKDNLKTNCLKSYQKDEQDCQDGCG